MQGGLHAANTIKRRRAGKDSVPFTYRDLGSAASIGRFKAIVSVRDPPQWLLGLGRLVLRPHRVPERVRPPRRHHAAVVPSHDRALPARTRLQRRPHGRGPEPARRGEAKVMPSAFPVADGCRTGRSGSESPDGAAARRRHGGATPGRTPPASSAPTSLRPGPAHYIRRMILDNFLVTDQVAIVTASGRGIGAGGASGAGRGRGRRRAGRPHRGPAPRGGEEGRGRRASRRCRPRRPDRLRPHGLAGRDGARSSAGSTSSSTTWAAPCLALSRYVASLPRRGLPLQRVAPATPSSGRPCRACSRASTRWRRRQHLLGDGTRRRPRLHRLRHREGRRRAVHAPRLA